MQSGCHAGIEFQIEDQVVGQFAFVAYTHPAVWEFRAVSDECEELYNREGRPIVAIHLWPGDNRVATKVVLPYVAEMEARLSIPGTPTQPKGLAITTNAE